MKEMVCEGNTAYIVEDIAADIATYRIVIVIVIVNFYIAKDDSDRKLRRPAITRL